MVGKIAFHFSNIGFWHRGVRAILYPDDFLCYFPLYMFLYFKSGTMQVFVAKQKCKGYSWTVKLVVNEMNLTNAIHIASSSMYLLY